MKISKDMYIKDILNLDDRAGEILLAHGLNCNGCSGADSATLEEAIKGHDADFESILKDLETLLK